MGRRIFRNMVLAAVLAVLLSTLLIVSALYTAHEESMRQELRQQTESIARALAFTAEDETYLASLDTTSRITLISSGGAVLFDSAADANSMENHLQRPEVLQAMKSGFGESLRTSSTLAETTLYCAQRTADGTVLRIAQSRRSMLGTFLNVLPLLTGILLGATLFSFLMARRAARKIVQPINTLNLDAPLQNETYDELAPLLARMHQQHEQLHRQLLALENARSELAAIMGNMREGMILLDKSSTVLSVNESAAQIFSLSSQAAIGQPLLSITRDVALHRMVQRALTGEAGYLPVDHGEKQYEFYISPVMKAETIRGVVLLLLDVTERFSAEKSRREFTANVSHELKTPLTAISGFAEIIRDGIAQPQDIPHFADMIGRESARLLALVNDILMLSQLDEQQTPSVQEPVSLLPLLRALTDDFSAAAAQKHLTLTLSGDEATVSGSPVLLREMFFNLIDNAVKYTQEGGAISITVQAIGGKVLCSVTDNGVGIPPEHQSRVFERFYRVDKSHSRQTGGTGLGLAIVKHIAQLHRAEIHLESAVQAGTTVQVVFLAPGQE